MLHENFEALIANIASQIDQLPVEELPALTLTPTTVSIDTKGSTRTTLLLNLLTPQPGHTFDLVFDQELQDAFAHNGLTFITLGDNLAYGLRRISTAVNEPAVFWVQVVCHDRLSEITGIVNELTTNTPHPQVFNITTYV